MLFVVLNVLFIITVFICCFSACLLFQCTVCCFTVHIGNSLLSLLYNTLNTMYAAVDVCIYVCQGVDSQYVVSSIAGTIV